MKKEFCPRCGEENLEKTVLCYACGWLLSNEKVPENKQIARDESKRLSSSVAPDNEDSSVGDSISSPEPVQHSDFSRSPDKKYWATLKWLGWSISGLAIIMAGVFSQMPHRRPFKPYHYSHKQLTAIRHSSSASRVASSSPSTRPSSSTTSTTPSSSTPSSSTRSSSSTPSSIKGENGITLSSTYAQLQGKVKNNQLTTTVWLTPTHGTNLHPVTLQVDTGAQYTMISGQMFQSLGGQQTARKQQFSGIGGTTTEQYWGPVYLYTDPAKAQSPLINGTPVPGGLGRTVTGQDGVTILLGENILKQGRLVQNGSTWTFTLYHKPDTSTIF